MDARRVGAKQRDEVASRQGSARDAAIKAILKATDPQWHLAQEAVEASLQA